MDVRHTRLPYNLALSGDVHYEVSCRFGDIYSIPCFLRHSPSARLLLPALRRTLEHLRRTGRRTSWRWP